MATAILEAAADDICAIAETVAARLSMGREDEAEVPIVLAGGIVSSAESYLCRRVAERLARTLPRGIVRRPSMTSSEAAARLAARLHEPVSV